ncbi:hypothetical protein MASR2M47_42520 [Draconibacterium sp.]
MLSAAWNTSAEKRLVLKATLPVLNRYQQYLETIISKLNQAKQQLTGRTAMEMFADEKDLYGNTPDH